MTDRLLAAILVWAFLSAAGWLYISLWIPVVQMLVPGALWSALVALVLAGGAAAR